MTANPTSGSRSSEENDGISQKLDVEQQILSLLICQLPIRWVKRHPSRQLIRPQSKTQISRWYELSEFLEVNREGHFCVLDEWRRWLEEEDRGTRF